MCGLANPASGCYPPHMGDVKPAPIGAEAEGTALKRPRGRPRKGTSVAPPLDSVTRAIKGVEQIANEVGELDFSLTRKQLATDSAITLERGLRANEQVVPLKQKVEWALRIAPFIAMLETLVPKDTGASMPKTEKGVEAELGSRIDNLKKMFDPKAPLPANVEAILSTYAPAATQPPEEA